MYHTFQAAASLRSTLKRPPNSGRWPISQGCPACMMVVAAVGAGAASAAIPGRHRRRAPPLSQTWRVPRPRSRWLRRVALSCAARPLMNAERRRMVSATWWIRPRPSRRADGCTGPPPTYTAGRSSWHRFLKVPTALILRPRWVGLLATPHAGALHTHAKLEG